MTDRQKKGIRWVVILVTAVIGALAASDPSRWLALIEAIGALAARTPPSQTQIEIKGLWSTFGGPWDTREAGNPWSDTSTEGLALWSSAERQDLISAGLLISDAPTTVGLARQLDPSAPYVAARWPGWDTDQRPRLRRWYRARGGVLYAPDGTGEAVWAVDYGPAAWTGRAVDMSPGLARRLRLRSSDLVRLVIPAPPGT